eukprot:887111-Alexandrium_andersonii.AAC.1
MPQGGPGWKVKSACSRWRVSRAASLQAKVGSLCKAWASWKSEETLDWQTETHARIIQSKAPWGE